MRREKIRRDDIALVLIDRSLMTSMYREGVGGTLVALQELSCLQMHLIFVIVLLASSIASFEQETT